MSKRAAEARFEAQRKQRLAWCKANSGIEDDISKYWGKAKVGFKAVSDWWNGNGDYEIVSNSLIHGGTKAAMQPLVVSNSRNGGEVRIRFREYLGDVRTHPTTVGAWYNTAYTLNAGNLSTFPWLASIAQQYEQWTPNGIIFEFRSTATEYSTSVNLGSVIMATDYDYADADYQNKMEALNSAYSAESKVSTELQYHGIECAPQSNPARIFYVNPLTTVPAGTSKHEYFLGRFQIATVGSSGAANSIVGSLYINYDITLRKPQFTGGLLARGQLFDNYTLVGAVLKDSPLGVSSPTRSADSNLGTTCVLNTIVFPPSISTGCFRITWGGTFNLAATTLQRSPLLSFSNCAPFIPEGLAGYGDLNNNQFAGITGNVCSWSGNCWLKVTAPGAVVTFGQNGSTAFNFDTAFLQIELVSSDVQS